VRRGEHDRAVTLYRERAEALEGAARCAGDAQALDAARQLLASR
jgi:hypothetical protein